jgi:cytochrome oxidase Cu insertion factor (SCO1/SenC/PrrC family)
MRLLRNIALPLAIVGSTMVAVGEEDQPRVKVGETAPAFTLKDQNGAEAKLADLLADKPTALVFYRSADW